MAYITTRVQESVLDFRGKHSKCIHRTVKVLKKNRNQKFHRDHLGTTLYMLTPEDSKDPTARSAASPGRLQAYTKIYDSRGAERGCTRLEYCTCRRR